MPLQRTVSNALRFPCFLLLFTVLAGIAIAQNQQVTIYYNSDWKRVSSKDRAEYYRVVEVNKDKKPVGIARDYYISGKIQWECVLVDMDWEDANKSTPDGKCTWYHENGKVARTSVFVRGTLDGPHETFHDNGVKESTGFYAGGDRVGKWIYFYRSGKIQRLMEDISLSPDDPWVTECDEFGVCEKVFDEDFKSAGAASAVGWRISRGSFLPTGGLYVKQGRGDFAMQTVKIPVDIEQDFSIETVFDYRSGTGENAIGLIYGFKDADNHHYFFISPDGYFMLGTYFQGIHLESKKWTQHPAIAKGRARNKIKISRLSDKLFFTVNGSVVFSEKFGRFFGNTMGIVSLPEDKEVVFSRFVVRQDTQTPDATPGAPASGSDWTSSGTGFFIDSRGYIVTNHHVVEDAKKLEVRVQQGREAQSFSASVIVKDKTSDLAIIKIDDPRFKGVGTIPYAINFSAVDVGTGVFTLGFPATQILGDEMKFTDGKISSKTGYQGDITSYQVSVPVQPGNSGGPLFDAEGNLVGVVNASVRGLENVSYAVKTMYLSALVDSLSVRLNLPAQNATVGLKETERINKVREFVVRINVKE